MSFYINILDLIEELDGAGLIITDPEMMEEELVSMGIDLGTRIPYDDHLGEDEENEV